MKKPTDKDSPAAALARMRWRGIPPAERSEITRRAANARWARTSKERAKKRREAKNKYV